MSSSLAICTVIFNSIHKRLRQICVLVCCAFLLADLAHAEVIRMGGTGSAMPLMQKLAEGRYPLANTLILITDKQSNEATLAFVQYLQNPQVSRMLREWDYIPANSLRHEK